MRLRRASVIVIMCLLASIIGCGCSKSVPAEENGEEKIETDSSEEAQSEDVEQKEDEKIGIKWVITPNDEYTDIGEMGIDFGFYAGEANREYYRQFGSCVKEKIGYPQQWYDGLIQDVDTKEIIGSFTYDAGVISVQIGSDEDARWGIIDYDGNQRHGVEIDSPITGSRLATLQGIGFRDMTKPPEIPEARYHILSGDYSEIEFTGYLPTGVGLPETTYFYQGNDLFRGYQSDEAEKVDEIPEELRNTLVRTINEGSEDVYRTDGYEYISRNMEFIEQEGYYHKNFVNGYYVAFESEEDIQNTQFNDDYTQTYLSPKCIIKAETGERITDFIYDDILYFEEGYCPVNRDGKWGLINENGEEVTDICFDKISSLYHGKVAVILDGKFGIIDFGDESNINKDAVRTFLANS